MSDLRLAVCDNCGVQVPKRKPPGGNYSAAGELPDDWFYFSLVTRGFSAYAASEAGLSHQDLCSLKCVKEYVDTYAEKWGDLQ